MKHNASKTRKTWTRILLVAAFVLTLTVTVGRQPFSPAKQAQAKTVSAKEYKKYEHVKVGKTQRTYWYTDVKKVKSSDKSVLTAKVTKKRQSELKLYGVVVRTKKKGTAKVTVKLSDGSKDVIKYDVGGALKKQAFNKSEAKKAFKIQNSYRAEVGVADLEWSDELYEFAKYRLETSGYDSHENMTRDAQDYFGDFYMAGGLSRSTLSENLAGGQTTAQEACRSWKNSPGHYKNLLKENWQCGAIAYDESDDNWIAVFSFYPVSHFEKGGCATVTVRCLDSASGEYLTDTSFFYYDADDITVSGSTTTYSHAKIGKIDATGKLDLALEIGKTYVLHCSRNKTHKKDVTLTVTGDCEVILTI